MSYYGNTPSWVYKQEIDSLKVSGHIADRLNKEQTIKSIEKILGVVDYSIISMWCDLNGYYYPIKKDFEKLEQIDKLQNQIKEIESEINQVKYKFGLSWRDKDELNVIDKRIAEREAEVKRCENNGDSESLKKANTLYKTALTRKKSLAELKKKSDNKIADESKHLIEKQNDLRQQIDRIKG